MKRFLMFSVLSAAFVLAISCQKTPVANNGINAGEGYLSFEDFILELDEEVDTKAAASGNYTIMIMDTDEKVVLTKSYSEVKNNNSKLSLPAGTYTLVARSTEDDVPVAEFEQPVYGTTHPFTIAAGEITPVGELTCTLLQCKVTVAYSDDFLAMVTGSGSTSVELTAGYPLVYSLNADKTYDQHAGFFSVNGSTMTVSFKGSIEGKTMSMSKQFTGIAAKQWRQVKFVPKKNEQGSMTFDIVINDLISDETIDNNLTAEEDVIAPDPNAPEDDGGIKMVLAEGCDNTITYSEENIVYDPDGNKINSVGLINIPIRPLAEDGSISMSIKFNAIIPEGLAELTVDIDTDSEDFAGAVSTANATHIDLVNPVCDPLIFDVVPFRHGNEILGLTEIEFDLSKAQVPILAFSGNHVFTMTIVDENGKTKVNKVTMVVE